MKYHRMLKIIKVVALLFISSNSFAQIDLSFGSSTTNAVSVPQGGNAPLDVQFQVLNTGNLDAADGVTLTIVFDTSLFTLNSVPPAPWGCAGDVNGLICDYFGSLVAATGNELLPLQFIVGATVSPNSYPFSANLFDVSETEVFTSNNDAGFNVTVDAGAPNLQFQGVANPPNVTEGAETDVFVDFTIENTSATPADMPSTALVITYDPANFKYDSLNSLTPFLMCTESILGKIDCGDFCTSGCASIDQGNPLDFHFAFQLLTSTGSPTPAANNYNFVGKLNYNAAEVDANTKTLVVDAVASETDLLLRKFVKDAIGGALINGTTIPLNSTYFYSIQVENTSPVAADTVKMTDDLPVGVEVVGFDSDSNGWNCTWSGFDVNSSQQVICTNPNIAAATNDFIYLQVQARSSGTKLNSASVTTSTMESDPLNNSNDPNSSNIIIDAAPPADVNMIIAKDIISGAFTGDLGNLEATQGTQLIYKILVDNITAGIPANNIVITDTLPLGVDLDFSIGINALGNFHTSMGGNCTYDSVSRLLTCTAIAIPVTDGEDGVEITVTVVGNVNDVVSINTATVTADNIINDASASSESFTIVTGALPVVDLTSQKDAQDVGSTISKNNFIVNDVFEYKIVIHNVESGDAPIGSLEVMDQIPAGVSLNSVPVSSDWDCSNSVLATGLVACTNLTAIPASVGFLKLIIPVTAMSEGNAIQNTATVFLTDTGVGLVSEPVISNNTGVFDINIASATTDLTFTKTVIGGSVTNVKGGKKAIRANPNFAIGDIVTYTLLVTNNSTTSSISDMVVQDPLDSNFLSFANLTVIQSSANFTCAHDGVATVNCDNIAGTPFLPGDSFEVEIQATAAAAGIDVNNVGFLSSAAIGTNISSNPVLIDIDSGLLLTSLTVDKQAIFDGLPVASVSKGSVFTYRVNVSNSGTEIASNIHLVDDMPVGVIVNNFTGAGWVCSNVAQQFSCDLLTQLAPGATTFIDFEVTDNSLVAITQLQNNVDVVADNAPLQTASNIINLTTVGLTVNVAQNPDPVVENTNFEIVVDLVNTGTEPLSEIQAVNTLPTGFSYNSTKVKAANCTQSGSVMTCTVSTPIGIGITESIVIPVTAVTVVDTNTIYTNTTVISGSNLPSSLTQQTTLNVSPTGASQGDISLLKTASVTDVLTDGVFQYTLSVSNLGSSNVTDVTVIDNLPAGVVLDSISATNWICQGTSQIVCTQTSMAAGTSSNIVINVIAPSTLGTITNTAQVSMIEFDTNSANNSSQVSVNVNSGTTPTHDVGISKTASLSEIAIAGSFQYTLTAFNNGTEVATGLTVSDILPSGVQLDSIDAANWSCSGTTQISCTQSSLNAGTSSNIVLHVTAPNVVGTVTNVANVTMNETDNDPTNDSSQVSVNVISGGPGGTAHADLQVTKTASLDELTSGEQLIWTIEIFNSGPDVASQVVMNDVLPTGFDLITAQTSNGSCTTANSTVDCSMTSIDNHETVTITLIGTASIASGLLDNIATVTTETGDPDSSNDSDMASVMVNAIQTQDADVSVSISTSNDIAQGGTATFDILTQNNGPDSASNTTLNIAVVGLLDNVSITEPTDWSCQVSGFIIGCHFNNELMRVGYQSTLSLTVETTRVVLLEQDVVVNAIITTTSNDPDMSNNVVSTQIGVEGTPTEGEIFTAMQTALNGAGSQQVNQAIENVSSYCERKYFNALEGLCADLYGAALSGDGETIIKVMEEITPSEVIGQSSSVSEIATAQFRNVGSRLSALRGGGGSGFSTAGLNARYGNGSIPLGMLAYLNQTEDKTDGITKTADDFISPWGFFVNGSISMGERDATGRELGFDFDTFGITAGVDYRLDAKKVIGVAIGYASFDSKIEDTAKLESTGVTLTGYGSFYVNDNFYVDTRISYGKPDFDQSRELDFSVGDVHIQRTAVGQTDANQYSVAMSAGYNFHKNSWNITPNASISYVNTTINGFTETGAGDFNFRFAEQAIESMVWSAGVNLSKAISLKNGVITPQFDFNYNYESLNDSNDIRAWFVMAPADEVFIIETDSPDRTYGSAGLGIVYISSNGKQAYINYRSILGLEGFSRGTFNLGARFEF